MVLIYLKFLGSNPDVSKTCSRFRAPRLLQMHLGLRDDNGPQALGLACTVCPAAVSDPQDFGRGAS